MAQNWSDILGAFSHVMETSINAVSSKLSFQTVTNSIPTFHGEPNKAEDFIRSVDLAFKLFNDDHITTIKAALLCSKGVVAETIAAYLEVNPTAPQASWPDLREILEKQYGLETDPRSALQILKQTTFISHSVKKGPLSQSRTDVRT